MPIRWETNASAEMGCSAQDLINRQIVDDSDVLIGMFWTRLGTPTATDVSGTAEELQRFLDAGKPASLFKSRRPADLDTVDHDQFAATRDAGAGDGSWDLMESDRPVDFLPPGANYQYRASIDFGSPSHVNRTVRWLNPDDSEGTSRQSLSIY